MKSYLSTLLLAVVLVNQSLAESPRSLPVTQVDIIDEETGRGIIKDWPSIPERFEIPDYMELAKAYEYLSYMNYDERTHRFSWSNDTAYQQGSPYFKDVSILQPPFLDHFKFNDWKNFISQSTVLFPGLISSGLIGSDLTQMNTQMPSQLVSQPRPNLARMMKAYYHTDFRTPSNSKTENGIFTDHFSNHLLGLGNEFWFTLIPNVYAMQLQSLFTPNQMERGRKQGEPSFDELTRRAVDTLVRMKDYLKGNNPANLPVFEFSGVDIMNGTFRANDQNCQDSWGAGVRLPKSSVLCGIPQVKSDNETPQMRNVQCEDWYRNYKNEPVKLLELSLPMGIPTACYPLSTPNIPNQSYVYNKILEGCQVRRDNQASPKYESDTAGSFALLGLMAYDRWQDNKYLTMADESIRALLSFPPNINPFYEVQYSFGVLAAAQLNRHHGKKHNVHQLLKWVFSRSNLANMNPSDLKTWNHYIGSVDQEGNPNPNPTNVRPEVGTVNETWGTFPAYGFWAGKGVWARNGGYAFYMNTIHQAVSLAPVAKYYPEYATLMGKYLLNVASNSKVFFPTCLPKENQINASPNKIEELIKSSNASIKGSSPISNQQYCTNDFMTVDTKTGKKGYNYKALPYESFLKHPDPKTNGSATGDAVAHGWASTNLSFYSGAVTGFLARILKQTDIPEIPMWDLDATDFQSPKAFPTYLVYNPFTITKTVTVSRDKIQSRATQIKCGGNSECFVWDSISHEWLPTTQGPFSFTLAPGQARILSFVPPGTTTKTVNNRLLGTATNLSKPFTAVLDYNY